MNEIEKIQGRALKRIFNVPISTSYIGLIMETGTWPANPRIQYSIMMLYHNMKNTMISKVKQIGQEIGLKIKNVENMRKSKWKKQV